LASQGGFALGGALARRYGPGSQPTQGGLTTVSLHTTLSLALLTAVAVLPAPSYAATGPAGSPCRLYSAAPQNDPDVYDGVLLGGPYAASGTLTCGVQVGAAAHSAPDDVARSATGTGAVLVPPSQVAPPWTGAPMYVCTQFTPVAGATVYWSDGAWTDDPAAPCDAYRDALDTSAGVGQELDVVLCPALAALRTNLGAVVITPAGDVFVAGTMVWDCPPYGA
jgi:hypothetical protein